MGEMGDTGHGHDAISGAAQPDVLLRTIIELTDDAILTCDLGAGSVDRIVIVGCQPANLDEGMGLSPAVQAAVDAAADLCLEVIAQIPQPVERGTHR